MRSADLELLRPWKLATLAAGLGLLVWGSFAMPAPDWGIADSIVLAIFAYLTAPWVIRVWFERRWRWMPAALVLTWLGSAGVYQAYWLWRDPAALEMMQDAAIPANLALNLAVGLLWAPRGSLREIASRVPVVIRGASRLGRGQP
jgi:hypothetical protein